MLKLTKVRRVHRIGWYLRSTCRYWIHNLRYLHCYRSKTGSNYSSRSFGPYSWIARGINRLDSETLVIRRVDVNVYFLSPNMEFCSPTLRILELRRFLMVSLEI